MRSRASRISAAVAIALAIFAPPAAAQACPGAGSDLRPRTAIPLFRYPPTDSAATSQFELFRSVLARKLSTLAEEAKQVAPQAPKASFPSGLRLYLPGNQPLADTLEDAEERKRYWEGTNSLHLLRGRVWVSRNTVQSDIYLGELRGAFPHPEVTVELAIDADSVSSTNDSHSLVTYFALAMEARRLGCDRAIVKGFLARARSIISDMRRRNSQLAGDLALLAQVVAKEK